VSPAPVEHSRPTIDIRRRLVAEGIGTALLVAVVVGSGIMGDQLADGNDAVALLGNTLATGAALVVLILIFGPISGAHFNPVVSLSFALQGELRWTDLFAYLPVQVAGGIGGTLLAHVMFDQPLIQASLHVRTGIGIWVGEIIASFALLATIIGCLRSKPDAVPYAVGLVITAGYWFTSSTSFANPAVTVARSLTATFSGIRPLDAPAFILAQILGALAATIVMAWLWSARRHSAAAERPIKSSAE
jgi:glycerol uptake facilitator-like aquaporin